jgi:RNA polymerase sporulation-specific sigma factor
MRYGLGGKTPLTQRQTAEICGISRSYVSRIEKRALEKLRRRFDRDDGI